MSVPDMARDRQQIIGLAGIFQAAELADQIATQGRCDGDCMRASIESVMVMDAARSSDVFPAPASLRVGLEALKTAFTEGQSASNTRTLGYAMALIQLTNRLRRDDALLSIMRNRLVALAAQRPHFPDPLAPELAHRLAGIYVDTLGTYRFRIRVQGTPRWLQDETNAARIRALFLAGVRSAFLWHQAGGRRWHLLLGRRRLLRASEDLY